MKSAFTRDDALRAVRGGCETIEELVTVTGHPRWVLEHLLMETKRRVIEDDVSWLLGTEEDA